MRKIIVGIVIGCLLVGSTSIIGTAFSQTLAPGETKGVIDLTPIIVALINLVIPAVGGIATYVINQRVKDQQLASQLSNAVQNALGTVQQNAQEYLQSSEAMKFTVSDPVIQKGVQYVLDNAKEALTHFDVPRERIAEKIVAKIGLAAIDTNRAATASPAPGISGPLAPVPAVRSL